VFTFFEYFPSSDDWWVWPTRISFLVLAVSGALIAWSAFAAEIPKDVKAIQSEAVTKKLD
jgi:uncharacterized integral membrane protein